MLKSGMDYVNKRGLDSKVRGANMGPIWVLSAPGGPHVSPINLAVREVSIVVTYNHYHHQYRIFFIMQCYHYSHSYNAWWRHQMETFSALLIICTGNSPVPGEFPAQRPVTRSFGVFFDLHPNKRLRKQWWGWWFQTSSCPLWRHRNGCMLLLSIF